MMNIIDQWFFESVTIIWPKRWWSAKAESEKHSKHHHETECQEDFRVPVRRHVICCNQEDRSNDGDRRLDWSEARVSTMEAAPLAATARWRASDMVRISAKKGARLALAPKALLFIETAADCKLAAHSLAAHSWAIVTIRAQATLIDATACMPRPFDAAVAREVTKPSRHLERSLRELL